MHNTFIPPCVKMRSEYVNTMDGDIIRYDRWYVDPAKFNQDQRRVIDRWCRNKFGSYRHDTEVDEGWWLQNEDEFTLFVLTWIGGE
jgi:hypothetical protein